MRIMVQLCIKLKWVEQIMAHRYCKVIKNVLEWIFFILVVSLIVIAFTGITVYYYIAVSEYMYMYILLPIIL